ncbi:MAG: DUF2723 domain-containing protein [Candidatus Eremiobacteraeota bacterium]|nr:DUF2723 domain-containing protein [Candidatus Eremiobacteraeota bacterium]
MERIPLSKEFTAIYLRATAATSDIFSRTLGPGLLQRLPVVAAFLLPLIAYCSTANPSVNFWDTGELQTVPYILGIAHPTGFPTFILLGWLFTHAVPFGNIAWRTTLMCAVAMSLSSAYAYQLGLRFCGNRLAALFGAMFFAAGTLVWSYATRTEVQSLSLLLRVVAIYELIVWRTTLERRRLFMGWLSFGLAESTHGIAALSLPGLILLTMVERRAREPRTIAIALAAAAIGLLPYAYLPIRSSIVTHAALDPTTSLGFVGGMPFWDYNHPSTLAGFLRLTTGSDFDVREGLLGIFDVRHYGTFLRYLLTREWIHYGAVGTIALYGIFTQYRRERGICIAFLLLALVPVPFINSYRALADPDRYLLITLWITSLFVAVGLAAVLESLRRALPRSGQAVVRIGMVILAAVLMLRVHRSVEEFVTQRTDASADQFIADVQRVTPHNSIIVAAWNYATPLGYAAYVKHSMGGRIVVVAWPNQYAGRYKRWLRVRPIFLASDSGLHVPNYRLSRVAGPSRSLYEVQLKKMGAR